MCNKLLFISKYFLFVCTGTVGIRHQRPSYIFKTGSKEPSIIYRKYFITK